MEDDKWLKEAIDKLDIKVDKLDQRITNMHERHIKNTTILEEHIYRTELNEENISLLREEFKPIEKNIQMIHGGLKLIGLFSVSIGIIEGLIKIFGFFS